MDPIGAGLNETARMVGERLALAKVLQVHVAAQEATGPGDDPDFGCDPMDLGKKPRCAFRIVAHKARLRPPAGPALAIHRAKKRIDALDSVCPQAFDQRGNLVGRRILVHPMPAHPQGVIAPVEHPALHLCGACRGCEDAYDSGHGAKRAQHPSKDRCRFRTGHDLLS